MVNALMVIVADIRTVSAQHCLPEFQSPPIAPTDGVAAAPGPRPHGNATAGVCHQWQATGKCSFGQSCKFAHVSKEGGSTAAPANKSSTGGGSGAQARADTPAPQGDKEE